MEAYPHRCRLSTCRPRGPDKREYLRTRLVPAADVDARRHQGGARGRHSAWLHKAAAAEAWPSRTNTEDPGVYADLVVYISTKPAEEGVTAFSTQCMMDQYGRPTGAR